MSDLIARLREAKGASRELDAEIACMVTKAAEMPTPDEGCEIGTYWQKTAHGAGLMIAPAYTGSIDDALALTPDGWTRSVDATAPELLIDVELYAPGEDGKVVRGTHASEPIATCIASLLARGIE